jgi:hypothetical protein
LQTGALHCRKLIAFRPFSSPAHYQQAHSFATRN